MSGLLSRSRRGLILTTKDDKMWIVDCDQPADELVGAMVVIDGIAKGTDRVRADWIGRSPNGN